MKTVFHTDDHIVQFQKISIPTPRKINGNSEGVGGLKDQNFKRKVWDLSGNSRGVGGFKPKNLPWEGYGYFLEQHIVKNGTSIRCWSTLQVRCTCRSAICSVNIFGNTVFCN